MFSNLVCNSVFFLLMEREKQPHNNESSTQWPIMEKSNNNDTTNCSQLHRQLSPHDLQKSSKRSLLALLSLLLLLLLVYNGAAIFSLQVPLPATGSGFSPEKVASESRKWPSSSPHSSSSSKLSSTVMYSIKEEQPPSMPKTHLPIFEKSQKSVFPTNDPIVFVPRRRRKRRSLFKILRSEARPSQFSNRVKEFFNSNSCKVRFFMTWISSLESFGDRELFAVESLFKSHPNSCLLIISNSLDSRRGLKVLSPFSAYGFHLAAISPDFDYLFKHTAAETWFKRLKKGNIDTGEVSLGQNLSNLLRLALLYKFGGIYIDTDVIVLKSLKNLKNVIGAQTIDLRTGNWSRLNNAVMIFDKGHPLLHKFIEEFALTFDGNKWGHNGPYLVSRVVSRVEGRPGFEVSVLPPVAFYPLDWSRIRGLFRGPRNQAHSKWLRGKLNHIRRESYAVHLWNRQSRKVKIEEGSIINSLMLDSCVFCNSSASGTSVLQV